MTRIKMVENPLNVQNTNIIIGIYQTCFYGDDKE